MYDITLRQNCVFADKHNLTQCSALNEYYCNIHGKCRFFKDKDEWYLDEKCFPRRKEANSEK